MSSNQSADSPEQSGSADAMHRDGSPPSGVSPEAGSEVPAETRTVTHHKPTVVGIGASAGGLNALKSFFRHVPGDSGLAFVVVVHLAPQHESHLSDLLQPSAVIPVSQVTETTSIEPNRVYIIPPNANLSAIDTHLRLSKLEADRKDRAPIDNFFRTMAATHDGDAVGVILTGTGSDGTLGIKDIKAKGGLIIVQDPNEAEFDGMPQSAVATGLVDRVLSVTQIPEAIIRYDRTTPSIATPEQDGEDATRPITENEQSLLQKVFAQLRARTDRDFSRYKQSTILRRIARRMQLHYIADLQAYLEKLRSEPEEVKALADDLLITVTNFFRDSEVFDRMETEVIPRLFKNKGPDASVRVWCVGCATGEEAYSLAMLLVEQADKHDSPPHIQIFASDLHKRSLERGREGLYPGDIATDVSVERLNRFFQKENGGYRIRKEIRDLVVFAPHNLLGDPPFSRLDLITCRNLLIYLQRHAQRDVIELFHYSLLAEGTLVLGMAEGVDAADLFRTEDKRLCFYRKRNVPAIEPRLPVFPISPLKQGRQVTETAASAKPTSHGMMHQQFLELYARPSILVAPDDRILHFSENVGRYLVHPGGEPTTNLYLLVREELRLELRAALQIARRNNIPSDSSPVSVTFDGHQRPVIVRVRPGLTDQHEGYALISFEEHAAIAEDAHGNSTAAVPTGSAESARIDELERELTAARQRNQALVEEYESSQEEMKASAEEMQSTNEELRSTMEELETSKEELQSINEELQTLNQENRHKVEELSQLSSDLQNLLSATDIATLFLDRELRILRFTPKLANLFNVRIQDRGRPISDLTHRLSGLDLASDAATVLANLIPVEREIQDAAGSWFLTRLLPYRSTEDRILGVVVTFVDITARRNAEITLRVGEERLRRMISVNVVGVLIFNESGTLLDSNDAFLEMCGYSRQEVASRLLTWRRLTPPEYIETSEQQLETLRVTGRLGPYEKEFFRKDGSRLWMVFAGAALGDGSFIEYCIDLSDRKRVEFELLQSKRYAESIIETLHEPLLVLTHDLQVRSANPAFYHYFSETPAGTLNRSIYDLGDGQWNIPELRKLLQEVLPDNNAFDNFEVTHRFDNIGERTLLLNGRRLEDAQMILLGIRDVTKERTAAAALRESELKFRLFVESVSDYALFQLDLNGCIRSWNLGAERLLGWKEEEVIDKDVSVLFTPEDVAAGQPEHEMQTALQKGRAEDERWHLRRDGSRFFASGVLTWVSDSSGQVIGFAKIMRDVTARKEYEEHLQQAVEQKTTLVREIHHRVKNNLQVVASLLNMQARHTKHPDVLTAFEEAEGRLRAIARIHEALYSSEDLTQVEFSAYLQQLVRELAGLHPSGPEKVAPELDASEVVLHVEQAIPLGLIANELILNALKHGMQGANKLLQVRLRYIPESYHPERGETRDDGWIELEVRDSGPGFPPGFDVVNTASLGLRIIKLLVRQLHGRFEIRSAGGAQVTVSFPLKRA